MFKGGSEIAPVKGKLQCGQYFPFQGKKHSVPDHQKKTVFGISGA